MRSYEFKSKQSDRFRHVPLIDWSDLYSISSDKLSISLLGRTTLKGRLCLAIKNYFLYSKKNNVWCLNWKFLQVELRLVKQTSKQCFPRRSEHFQTWQVYFLQLTKESAVQDKHSNSLSKVGFFYFSSFQLDFTILASIWNLSTFWGPRREVDWN